MKRTLTKKHIFDYEMKYRDKIDPVYSKLKFNLKLFDMIVYSIDHNFKDYNKAFNFIDDFVDLINFNKFIRFNRNFTRKYYKRFLNKYNLYLDKEAWDDMTYCVIYGKDKRYITKYKDKLNMNILGGYCHNLPPEFLIECKDDINIRKILSRLVTNDKNKIIQRIIDYTEDHLEEVLSYKREDNTNEKKTN